MEFRSDDKRQPDCQGALVCQDWQGFGSISESDWFSAADLPSDARIHGMIHFLFACYGGGWETFDTFRDGPNGQARQIAPKPGVSRLPQAMLTHPEGGALAVIAHVDRAWSYSFETTQGGPQNAGMWEVLTRITMGQRIGSATDGFNIRWAALSATIADALRDFKNGDSTGRELAARWIARDDARNYTILGDPSVRLRVNDLAEAV
jgi:Peptidase family C25